MHKGVVLWRAVHTTRAGFQELTLLADFALRLSSLAMAARKSGTAIPFVKNISAGSIPAGVSEKPLSRTTGNLGLALFISRNKSAPGASGRTWSLITRSTRLCMNRCKPAAAFVAVSTVYPALDRIIVRNFNCSESSSIHKITWRGLEETFIGGLI